MLPILSIYSAGILTVAIAIFHTRFYTLFDWKTDLDKISVSNARIIYTVHFALLLLFFLTGIITIVYARELSEGTGLARGLDQALAVFWLWRLVWQFVYFKRQSGQKLHPRVIVLIIAFFLLVVCYLMPVVYEFR